MNISILRLKCQYVESANFIESYVVHFDTNGPSNLTEI